MHMEQPLHSHAGQADLHAHHPFPGGLPPAGRLQLDGIGILNRHLRMGLREHVNLVPPCSASHSICAPVYGPYSSSFLLSTVVMVRLPHPFRLHLSASAAATGPPESPYPSFPPGPGQNRVRTLPRREARAALPYGWGPLRHTNADAILHMPAGSLLKLYNMRGCRGIHAADPSTEVVLVLRPYAAGGNNQAKPPGQCVIQFLHHILHIILHDLPHCYVIAPALPAHA